MNPPANTVAVTILDKEYQVACPPEQHAELLLSAQHLDQQMRAIRSTGKVIGLERIAVMAALNISHELLETRKNAGSGKRADGAQAAAGASGDSAAIAPEGLSGLNAKLDEALHQLRQLEIG
jgi:cell division protein ZapA